MQWALYSFNNKVVMAIAPASWLYETGKQTIEVSK